MGPGGGGGGGAVLTIPLIGMLLDILFGPGPSLPPAASSPLPPGWSSSTPQPSPQLQPAEQPGVTVRIPKKAKSPAGGLKSGFSRNPPKRPIGCKDDDLFCWCCFATTGNVGNPGQITDCEWLPIKDCRAPGMCCPEIVQPDGYNNLCYGSGDDLDYDDIP